MKIKVLLILTNLLITVSSFAIDNSARPFFDYSKLTQLGLLNWPYPVYGDIDSMVMHSSDGSEINVNTILKFNEKGDIDVASFFLEDSFLSDVKVDHKYDEKGFPYESLVTTTNDNSSSSKKMTYVYNDNGKITNLTDYSSNGEISKKTDYIYDEKGRLIEESVFYLWNQKMTYNYDDKGNLTEITYYQNPDSKEFKMKMVYKYDKKGRLTEMSTINSEGETYLDIKLKCDKRGNVIEESVYRKGKFTEITKCKITYR
ncbi:MAG: hypothetical protein J6R41_01455 [Paludibacteraceae bacterium]|nr:hypothetical protein [Paludibacteraceae bacterium]